MLVWLYCSPANISWLVHLSNTITFIFISPAGFHLLEIIFELNVAGSWTKMKYVSFVTFLWLFSLHIFIVLAAFALLQSSNPPQSFQNVAVIWASYTRMMVSSDLNQFSKILPVLQWNLHFTQYMSVFISFSWFLLTSFYLYSFNRDNWLSLLNYINYLIHSLTVSFKLLYSGILS